MDHKANLKAYTSGIQEVLDKLPWDAIAQAVEVLWQCCQRGGRIFTMGNGGHSNTAAHMINDLAKHTVSSDNKEAVVAGDRRFRTMCLNDSVSFLTGIGNDMGFDFIFSEQVANWVEPGDVVIGISGSQVAQTCSEGLRHLLYLARRIGRIAACRACAGWCSPTAISSSPAICGGRGAPWTNTISVDWLGALRACARNTASPSRLGFSCPTTGTPFSTRPIPWPFRRC